MLRSISGSLYQKYTEEFGTMKFCAYLGFKFSTVDTQKPCMTFACGGYKKRINRKL